MASRMGGAELIVSGVDWLAAAIPSNHFTIFRTEQTERMHQKLGRNTVVLLGIGHTNAHVLRMWKMQPIANAQLVCVSNFPYSTYSGMLPGVLAGQYPPEAMQIDLVRLCASAGARLIVGDVVGLDRAHHRLEFANRPPLHFELLSIGIGSQPTFRGVEVESDELLVPIKPMQTILERLRLRLAAVKSMDHPIRIAIVGGGIGSIEVAFCLHRRLQKEDRELLASGQAFEMTLITASEEVGDGLVGSTRQRIRELMEARGIRVVVGSKVKRVAQDHLELEGGRKIEADLAIWSTGAAAPELLNKLDLEKDENGFSVDPVDAANRFGRAHFRGRGYSNDCRKRNSQGRSVRGQAGAIFVGQHQSNVVETSAAGIRASKGVLEVGQHGRW